MKRSEQKKMTVSHFEKWLEGWNSLIETYDSRESYQIQKQKCEGSISVIDKLLNDSDTKVTKGKSEVEAGMALLENQEKKWYKDLTKVRNFLTVLIYDLEKMNEMNHRKTDEIFRLKAEIEKLNKVIISNNQQNNKRDETEMRM